MKNLSRIIATVLASLIGAMSVVAGSRVLLGIAVPDYHVLPWLVGYNVLLGVFSLVAAYLLWLRQRPGRAISTAIMACHAGVLLLLFTLFKAAVAPESIKAMAFRLIVWAIIVFLTFNINRNEK